MLLIRVVNKEWKMAKNGNKKEKLIRSINFGRPGEPARELIEIYERKIGKNKISKLVRETIVRELSADSEFDAYKIRQLTEERKNLIYQMKEIQNKIQTNFDKLSKLGLSDDEIVEI